MWSRPRKRCRVQAAISKYQTVALGILIEKRERLWIDAGADCARIAARTHRGDLRGGESDNVAARVQIIHVTCAKGIRRHRLCFLLIFRSALLLEIEKEEQTILHDRSAQWSAESILNELAGTIWQSGGELSLLIEPVVRSSGRVAVVLIETAVKLICTALGDN